MSDARVYDPADPWEACLVSRRPWGRRPQLTRNEPVTVKFITVDPEHRLSLQRHEHRGELVAYGRFDEDDIERLQDDCSR